MTLKFLVVEIPVSIVFFVLVLPVLFMEAHEVPISVAESSL